MRMRLKSLWIVFGGWDYSPVNYLPWMLPHSAFTHNKLCSYMWSTVQLTLQCRALLENIGLMQHTAEFTGEWIWFRIQWGSEAQHRNPVRVACTMHSVHSRVWRYPKDTDTFFFPYQIFQIPIPHRYFLAPNFSDTESETFFRYHFLPIPVPITPKRWKIPVTGNSRYRYITLWYTQCATRVKSVHCVLNAHCGTTPFNPSIGISIPPPQNSADASPNASSAIVTTPSYSTPLKRCPPEVTLELQSVSLREAGLYRKIVKLSLREIFLIIFSLQHPRLLYSLHPYVYNSA